MLHDLQREFAAAALSNDIAALVPKVQASAGSRQRRLGIYRTNTVNSLTDVLLAAFPVVERIVGERFFRAMATAFVEAHPPRRPTLYAYGEDLPVFLETFEPAQTLPYLPDVARLEWARIRSYFAADQDAIDPARLATVPSDALETVVFKVHPSLQLIRSSYPVFTVWTVNQPDHGPIPEIDFSEAECGYVLRLGHHVTQRQMSSSQFTWLRLVAEEEPFGRATEQAALQDGAFDLQETLRPLLAEGVFYDLHH